MKRGLTIVPKPDKPSLKVIRRQETKEEASKEETPESLIADLPEEGTNVEEAPSPVEPSVDQDKLESQIENFTTGQKNLVRRLVGVAQNEYQKSWPS